MPSVIVLAIDGLRASAIGAYGNTWRPTPGFDRIACESLLVEWAMADRPSPERFYTETLLNGPPWRQTRLITDDASVRGLPAFASFDEAIAVDPLVATAPADQIGETALANAFGGFADATRSDESDQGGPSLTWVHCRGLTGPWDAPSELIAGFVEEDDPTPDADVEPPSGRVDRNADPDTVFGAAARYAAQVLVLDACVEGWLESVDAQLSDTPPAMVLLGLRGFSLGEHGMLGIEEAAPYGESRHVPLLIRSPGQASPGRRASSGLLPLTSLPAMLASLASSDAESAVASAEQQRLVLQGEGARGVRGLDWHAVQHPQASAELYAKPDDRWEANDVASLKPEVVEAMLADSLAYPPGED